MVDCAVATLSVGSFDGISAITLPLIEEYAGRISADLEVISHVPEGALSNRRQMRSERLL
jgi:hypothetical protein